MVGRGATAVYHSTMFMTRPETQGAYSSCPEPAFTFDALRKPRMMS